MLVQLVYTPHISSYLQVFKTKLCSALYGLVLSAEDRMVTIEIT